MNATTPLRRGVATGVYPFTSNRKSARRVAARRTPVIIQEDGQRLQPDDGNNCTPDEEETIEGQEEEETVEGQGEKEPIVAADEGESARKEDMDGNERYEEDEDETLDEIELELSPGAEVVDKSSSGIPRIRKRQHEVRKLSFLSWHILPRSEPHSTCRTHHVHVRRKRNLADSLLASWSRLLKSPVTIQHLKLKQILFHGSES